MTSKAQIECDLRHNVVVFNGIKYGKDTIAVTHAAMNIQYK
jgi:hypothetical protein